ncbi:GNAT family N-acetyltransferase [Acidimangrovimonas sediminis]|uniref:GNAT family N-acetyltransferase n=1 Tax=Acidimangrovimonas sediminis TaxID=2056283 RepID=UPI001E287950|nr:GNAT family N-acetyltransferase [Acidimangrovimonas sediminis]
MVLDPQDLTIRPAAPADLGDMAALLNAIVRAGGTTAITDELTPEALGRWFLHPPEALFCHVALAAEGTLAGFQSVGRGHDLPEGWGDMATFARRGSTRRGIGGALFAATRARAVAEGLIGLNATIRADNVGGLAYYSRMGFADFDITPAAPLGDGTRVDRIHKRLTL